MANLSPNSPCPCGSGSKFKKCCSPYIQGQALTNAERVLRARYAAHVNGNSAFLWESLHPHAPRKVRDTRKNHEYELQLVKNLHYGGLRILDAKDQSHDTSIIVFWVEVHDGETDVSFLEESTFKCFEGRWYYFDGLRRSSTRLGCMPESIKIGDLESLFLHDSPLN